MGYYSEVAIALTEKGNDKFHAALTAEILKGELDFHGGSPFSLLEAAQLTDYDGAVLYHWPALKWYDGIFSDVTAIMRALSVLEGEEYMFVRVGEEYDDIEDLGDMEGPPYLGVETNISIA